MTDFATIITQRDLAFDLVRSGGDLLRDDTFYQGVLLSLFSDRRAEPSDRIPDGTNDPRGWWGDSTLSDGEARVGSRLWLLRRANATDANANLAAMYARESLRWMVDEGLAAKVDAEGFRLRRVNGDVLALQVSITRPDGSTLNYRFAPLWEAAAAFGGTHADH
jgi:phage gp46-like protein